MNNYLYKLSSKFTALAICFGMLGCASLSPVLAQTVGMQVLSPAGNEQWVLGSTQTISWTVTNSTSPVNISMISYIACQYTTPRCEMATVNIPIASNVSNSGSYSWNIGSDFSAGSYILSVTDVSNSSLTASSNVFTLVSPSSVTNLHASGTNVSNNGIVYYIQAPTIGGAMPINPPQPVLVAYTSAPAFLSYGFNTWPSVVVASNQDMQLAKSVSYMPYAEGSLVNDNGTVYAISNGSRHGIVSASVYLALGYQWTNDINGDTSFMPEGSIISVVDGHMPGTLTNENGTLYYITASGKMGIPNMTVFNSWGFNLNNVVVANSSDVSLPANSLNPLVSLRAFGQLSPVVSLQMMIPQAN